MNILEEKIYYFLTKNLLILFTKFTYSPLGKAFEKRIKKTESQDEKQTKAIEEHGRELVELDSKNINLLLGKKKEIFQDIINERMEGLEGFHGLFHFETSIFYYILYHKIKLTNAEKSQEDFKSRLTSIKIGGKKNKNKRMK